VDAFSGSAIPRWRANSSFAADCEVTAHVISTGSGWEVTVDATKEADEWGLNTLPNPWQLVFADGTAGRCGESLCHAPSNGLRCSCGRTHWPDGYNGVRGDCARPACSFIYSQPITPFMTGYSVAFQQ
jgi:hypothetical protein